MIPALREIQPNTYTNHESTNVPSGNILTQDNEPMLRSMNSDLSIFIVSDLCQPVTGDMGLSLFQLSDK